MFKPTHTYHGIDLRRQGWPCKINGPRQRFCNVEFEDGLVWAVCSDHIRLIEAPKIDFSKPVQTRDGQSVTILSTERPVKIWTVIGMKADGSIGYWRADGRFLDRDYDLKCPEDLVNVPPPKTKHTETRYLKRNTKTGKVWTADNSYILSPNVELIGMKEVTVTEGEGLSPQGCKGACTHVCNCE